MEVIVLKADYYDQFKCIGSRCQISCCNYNWSIYLDKTTYQKYKKFSSIGKKVNSDYTRKLRTSIELNPTSTNSTNYGRIKHIIDERAFIIESDAYTATECVCPFTQHDNLCDLQTNFGHDMLSLTCKTFPRNLNHVFEEYEQTLTTECEAVCALLYEIKEPLKFKRQKVRLDPNIPVNKTISEDMREFAQLHIVRAASLKILQSREFDLDNRMVLLGLFLSKISTLRGENVDKIPSHAKSFLESLHQYLEYFNIKVNHEVQGKQYSPQKMLLEAVDFDGIELGYIEKEVLIRIKNNLLVYRKNYALLKKKSDIFFKNNSHYVENVMVNLFIKNMFPFVTEINKSDTIVKKVDFIDNYVVFAWAYISLKVMLTGGVTLYDNKDLDLSLLYKITVIHSREVIGSNKMLSKMCEVLKTLGYSNVTQLAMLIGKA